MGYLKGTIQPTTQVELPVGSVIKLLVFRIPNYRRPGSSTSQQPAADLIGRAEISNARQFPIEFNIQYQDTQTPGLESGEFAVYMTVYIEKGSRILFSNEHVVSNEPITKNKMQLGNEYGDMIGKNGRYRRHLDVFLNQTLG